MSEPNEGNLGNSIDRLTSALARWEQLQDAAGHSRAGNNNRLQVNLPAPTRGERALWIVAVLGTAQAVATFFLVIWFLMLWIDNKDRGHQMNALYMSVPGLRELVEKTMKSERELTQPPKEEPQP